MDNLKKFALISIPNRAGFLRRATGFFTLACFSVCSLSIFTPLVILLVYITSLLVFVHLNYKKTVVHENMVVMGGSVFTFVSYLVDCESSNALIAHTSICAIYICVCAVDMSKVMTVNG